MENKKFWIYFLVFLIVALGFFLRIYNIDNTPPGVYPDEAVNGEDALRALKTGDYQWFYPANNGREGLMMNLVALFFGLFGVSVLTLKLPSIIAGTLTILGTYLLGKELFNTRAGLISSFLVSVAFWAINFSRISFRANLLPCVLVFTFYFLFKGLRTKKWYDFAAAGFIFGIGLHTYIAFRIAPLILVVALVSLILSRENFLKTHWKKIVLFAIFTALTASPMLYTFFYSHPEYLESRSTSISIMSPEVNKGHILQTGAKSFGLSLVKYTFVGDMNWRHNYPPYPLLDPLAGVAFLFGIIYSFVRLKKLAFSRFLEKIRNTEMDIYVFLIAWFFTMLAPEFLTAEGNPHSLRAIGTLPVVFIFSGITFDFILKKAEERSVSFKKIILGASVFALLSAGIFNAVKYHYFWANNVKTARSFEKPLMDISSYVKKIPEAEKVVLTGNMQRVVIKLFNDELPNISYLHPGQYRDIDPKKPADLVIIMTERDEDIINNLKQRFPDLNLEEVKDSLGLGFYILK